MAASTDGFSTFICRFEEARVRSPMSRYAHCPSWIAKSHAIGVALQPRWKYLQHTGRKSHTHFWCSRALFLSGNSLAQNLHAYIKWSWPAEDI
eukprot:CAMPEP_0178987684 /NCGR_PEP_ID=MMETSP0795-20121207/3399_1 /TAXON_ID=88552 /ORGANISM="Amoebophrya sp., Strain Ameob2" /LENGTH=92 /DNA_ID=CAMNT_0020678889 /DNA_START=444 /DNA_END=722 /DNA_ORIENTATION=-